MRQLRIALLASVIFAGPSFAQTMSIDLTKMPPEVAAAIVKAEQDRKAPPPIPPPPTPDQQLAPYIEVGKRISLAVTATANGLSMDVNEFVKTPIGLVTFAFIFSYFLGAKLWHIVGGILFWTATQTMIWRSTKHFFWPRKVLVSKVGRDRKYDYKRYEFKTDEARTASALLHVALFMATTLLGLMIVFLG